MLLKARWLIIIFFLLSAPACQKEAQVAAGDLKKLGTSAHNLLSAEKYTALLVEIDYMPGYAPDETSIANLKTFLNTYTNKPSGIQVVLHPVPASNKQKLSLTELVQLEKQNRSAFTVDNTIAVYFLIADASYIDDNTLGVSYWNTSTCLFGKNIFANAGNPGQVSRSKLYSTLLQHEFGHLLGLVNRGSPMQANHKDDNNGDHCNNPNCLMFYGIETSENLGNASAITELDAACKADLKANGGK